MLSIGWWLPVFDVIYYDDDVLQYKKENLNQNETKFCVAMLSINTGDVIWVAVFKFSLENLDYNTTIPTRLARPW
jgi:hypothetical protein